ncbi:MAG: phosphate propanoyltransferase [Oscillospiraceae bacterium]|jgi:putative phosphotransacetylase|nr:phosphate propanoyltransferase [Oscillospiraceae bacterium]
MESLRVEIEGSARHAHVTPADLQTLFGPGAVLHNKKELSQPGQYVTEERIRVEGPRGGIDRISILGPERAATQVEVSLTDARALGVTPPVRESGQLAGSAPARLVGPAGTLELPEGVIIAKRHIHVSDTDAVRYGLSDKEIVSVRVEGDRALTFGEVVIRVSPEFRTSMHIDIDEFNAAGLSGTATGLVVKP